MTLEGEDYLIAGQIVLFFGGSLTALFGAGGFSRLASVTGGIAGTVAAVPTTVGILRSNDRM